MENRLLLALKITRKNIFQSIPLIIGTLLLISLINSVFNFNWFLSILHFNILTNSIIGGLVGSLLAGSPYFLYSRRGVKC